MCWFANVLFISGNSHKCHLWYEVGLKGKEGEGRDRAVLVGIVQHRLRGKGRR